MDLVTSQGEAQGGSADPDRAQAFAAEVARLRAEKVPGASGRLRDLFDFLADRGPGAESASQVEISQAVFGQAHPDADDATVRVYVHRLRKRMEDHYGDNPAPAGRLEIPAGVYALQFASAQAPVEQPAAPAGSRLTTSRWPRAWPIIALAALALAFLGGWLIAAARSAPPPVNAIWSPLIASERPVLVVLGDYYIFGEIDPLEPENGRLIRDFRVDSATDLRNVQDLDPDRYAMAEDMGLTYLPTSSAFGLEAVLPLLAARHKTVAIISASELEADMLNHFDIVYIGLLSGMRLLEDVNFMGSGFAIGETYDELIDLDTGQSYVSEEARSLPSQAYYRDYAYLARYRAPSGALVIVLGGARDTGLRGLSPIAAAASLPGPLATTAREDADFEALFEVTGQQGADLSERLVISRARAPDEMERP